LSDHNKNSEKRASYTNGDLELRLETLRQVVYEMQYDAKNYSNFYLLGAELVTSYVEQLLRDGLLSKAEQSKILDEIFKVSSSIVEKVKEQNSTLQKIPSK
jgi:hypothetical protein